MVIYTLNWIKKIQSLSTLDFYEKDIYCDIGCLKQVSINSTL